jgi:ribokinase
MSGNVLVVGSLNMDLVIQVARLPAAGETVRGSALQTFCGGKGANQAVAARRLGGEVSMIGRVGPDEFGHRLRTGLEKEKVDVSAVTVLAGSTTGIALITVGEGGQNTIVVSPGANCSFHPGDLESYQAHFAVARWALFQLEIPLQTVVEGIQLAKKGGACTILNPAPAQSLPTEIWPLVDIVVPNEIEAAILTGQSTADFSKERAARFFLDQGARQVIITLGSKGAYFASATDALSIPPYRVEAVDATGAGDAFLAALAVGLTAGWEISRSLAFASAAGALATTKPGAQSSLPHLQEVEDFLSLQPRREM